MSKRGIKLPPLVLDGEAKVLPKMTLRELHVCLTRALRVAGGDSLEESGRSVFSVMEQPAWWPQELPFDAKFTQKIPPGDRSVCYRHLLSACYSYYKQEDTLHLFDCRPGEAPRWRLEQEGDEYTIFSRFPERPIWTYSTSFQILPLITLFAKQREQYKAAISEQLKKPKTNLVIQTRSQKANDRRQESEEVPGSDEVGDNYPMSPQSSQRLLSPDGSPRRFSIMNRLSTAAHRLTLPEIGAEQVQEKRKPAPFSCVKCDEKFDNKFDLMKHEIKFKNQPKCDPSSITRSQDQRSKKEITLFAGLGIVPRDALDNYEKSMINYKPAPIPKWKPQFVGCQFPLTSELGLRLFQPVEPKFGPEQFDEDFLPYEKYCGTRKKTEEISAEKRKSALEKNVDEKNEMDISDQKNQEKGGNGEIGKKIKQEPVDEGENAASDESKDASSVGQGKEMEEESTSESGQKGADGLISSAMDGQAPKTKNTKKSAASQGLVKIYPVVYRPPRLIPHVHIYKFNRAEYGTYQRTQRNGGLDLEARRLLKKCPDVRVGLVELTEEEMEKYGVSLEESDEEESESESESDESVIGPPGPRCSKKIVQKSRRRRSVRQPIMTRSKNNNQSSSLSSIQALAKIRQKYWPNSAYLRKRIGATATENVPAKRGRGRKRRSSARGLVPRRRFSLEGEEDEEQDKPGPSSLPSSPQRTVSKRGRGGRFASIKGSLRGRPRREHRLPARYRTPTPTEGEGGRRKHKNRLTNIAAVHQPSTPVASPTRIPIRFSPLKGGVPSALIGRSPRKDMDMNEQVAAIVSKILKKQITSEAIASVAATKKAPVRPLSVILPKEQRQDQSKEMEATVPPPYAMLTSEHVYFNLGGQFFGREEENSKHGRFQTPRPLSPATEERMRETVNEVVDNICSSTTARSTPIDTGSLRYMDGIILTPEKGSLKGVLKPKIEDDAISRCSSESTIVSAIFEVPQSSDEEDDDEQGWDGPISPRKGRPSEEEQEELPAAKRLKMTFSEICATPQNMWSRPALGPRKPAILGGRQVLKNPAIISMNTEENGQPGEVNGAENEKPETKMAENAQEKVAIPIEPATATAQVQKGPIIIVSSATQSSSINIVTSTQGQPQPLTIGGKAIRVMGGRLVAFTPRNSTPGSSVESSTATSVSIPNAVPATMTTGRSRVSTVYKPGTMAGGAPVRRGIPQGMADVVPFGGGTSPWRMGTTVQDDGQQQNVPQILRQLTSPHTCFKCNFCTVELSFTTQRAWQSIQYHMSVAHKNMNFKLRKTERHRPVKSVVIEAVPL